MRVGMGYDVHRLSAGRKLIIGGVEIPYRGCIRQEKQNGFAQKGRFETQRHWNGEIGAVALGVPRLFLHLVRE